MAPEFPPSLVIYDARMENGQLRGSCEYIEPKIQGSRLKVHWGVDSPPKGFQPISGGVAYIDPEFNSVPIHASPADEGEYHYRWFEGLNAGIPWVMFILVLPTSYTLSQLDPAPAGAQLFQSRLALYWVLRGDDFGRTQVKWTLSPLKSDPNRELVRLNRMRSSPSAAHTASLAIEDASQTPGAGPNAQLPTSAHVLAASPLLRLITVLGALLGTILLVGGVYLAFGSALANTKFNLFGNEFASNSVGVSMAFIGAVLVVLTFRRVLRSVDRLASLPDEGSRGQHSSRGRKGTRRRL